MSARRTTPASAPEPRPESVDAPDVVRLVDRLVGAAVGAGASDVHVEAADDGVRVRRRVDGIVREVERLPSAVGLPLVSRLKILAGLDIADRLRPQDGRARVHVGGRAVDVRVSTLPAARGESVVLRLQPADAPQATLDALGLSPSDHARLAALLDAREGLVLVTGPTGSGKTTTLYAALARLLARGDLNVVTVEDPVERRLDGAIQVQVNERTGLTFAAALRALLRQDPDVVLVGEIRDRETAAIAAQAALTGHLVLATLHTIDAASAVTRLSDVGVDPATVAAALRGVVAQRLVRRLCAACRERVPAGWRLAALGGAAPEGEACWTHAPGSSTPGPAGCGECAGAGYRGRVAMVEVLASDAGIAPLVARNAGAVALRAAARARGMATLWESGVALVRAGTTSVAELVRVADPPTAHADAAEAIPARPAATPVVLPVANRHGRPRLPDLDATLELLPCAARAGRRAP